MKLYKEDATVIIVKNQLPAFAKAGWSTEKPEAKEVPVAQAEDKVEEEVPTEEVVKPVAKRGRPKQDK